MLVLLADVPADDALAEPAGERQLPPDVIDLEEPSPGAGRLQRVGDVEDADLVLLPPADPARRLQLQDLDAADVRARVADGVCIAS